MDLFVTRRSSSPSAIALISSPIAVTASTLSSIPTVFAQVWLQEVIWGSLIIPFSIAQQGGGGATADRPIDAMAGMGTGVRSGFSYGFGAHRGAGAPVPGLRGPGKRPLSASQGRSVVAPGLSSDPWGANASMPMTVSANATPIGSCPIV